MVRKMTHKIINAFKQNKEQTQILIDGYENTHIKMYTKNTETW